MSDAEPPHQNVSKFFRFLGNFDWNLVSPTDYKSSGETWKGVTRRVFVGESGESPEFHLRYMEVEPDGYTSLERHQHEHAVVCMRGRGRVLAGDQWLEMGFGDVIYIAPGVPHQFKHDGPKEPFGFLCIVNAKRDRPQICQPASHPLVH